MEDWNLPFDKRVGEGFSDCEDLDESASQEEESLDGLLGALDFPLPDNIPPVYSDLAEVFSKQRATTLPPHRPYDCEIKLYPGTVPPKGSLYSLLIPESE